MASWLSAALDPANSPELADHCTSPPLSWVLSHPSPRSASHLHPFSGAPRPSCSRPYH
ncbi:hypothetical protein BDV10DRAFT_175918 [Aspergillus recurvatus]